MNTYYSTDSDMAPNRRTFVKNVGIAATIGGLAGCAGVSKQETTTTQQEDSGSGSGGDDSDEETTTTVQSGNADIWYARADSEAKAFAKIIEQFNDNSPHTIKGSDIAELQKKTTTAIPSGNGPQLFEFAHDWVGDYYQRGFLNDQSGNLEVDLDETFTEAAANAVRYDGSVLGVPNAAETVALIYNKDMVDSPPETLEDMQAVMDEYHDPSSGSYGLSYPINPYFISAWAHAYGGYYYDESDDSLGLTNDETLKGFRTILDQLLPYMPKDVSYGAQAAPFVEENAPFAINGPWYLGNVNDNDINAGVAALPKPYGGSPSPYTGISMIYFAKGMGQSETSANAARAFAEWYGTNEDLAMKAANEQGDIPVLSSLQGNEDLPAAVKGFSESVAMGRPMPTHPHMQKVWEPVGTAFGKAMNGESSLEDAMAAAEKNIKSEWDS